MKEKERLQTESGTRGLHKKRKTEKGQKMDSMASNVSARKGEETDNPEYQSGKT